MSIPCRFFQSGVCFRGSSCHFQHDGAPAANETEKLDDEVGLTPPVDPGLQQRCRFFLASGACRFGDSCRFLHSAGEPSQMLADPSTLLRNLPQEQRPSRSSPYAGGMPFFGGTPSFGSDLPGSFGGYGGAGGRAPGFQPPIFGPSSLSQGVGAGAGPGASAAGAGAGLGNGYGGNFRGRQQHQQHHQELHPQQQQLLHQLDGPDDGLGGSREFRGHQREQTAAGSAASIAAASAGTGDYDPYMQAAFPAAGASSAMNPSPLVPSPQAIAQLQPLLLQQLQLQQQHGMQQAPGHLQVPGASFAASTNSTQQHYPPQQQVPHPGQLPQLHAQHLQQPHLQAPQHQPHQQQPHHLQQQQAHHHQQQQQLPQNHHHHHQQQQQPHQQQQQPHLPSHLTPHAQQPHLQQQQQPHHQLHQQPHQQQYPPHQHQQPHQHRTHGPSGMLKYLLSCKSLPGGDSSDIVVSPPPTKARTGLEVLAARFFEPEPRRVGQDKFFGALLSRYDAFRRSSHQSAQAPTHGAGMVGGAHLVYDAREENRDSRGLSHMFEVASLARASGKPTLEYRIDGTRLLYHAMSPHTGRHSHGRAPVDGSPKSIAAFLLEHAEHESRFITPREGQIVPGITPVAVEVVLYLGRGSSLAKLHGSGDLNMALDEDLRGARISIDREQVAVHFNLLLAKTPRAARPLWNARIVLCDREACHSLFSLVGCPPDRIVFARYTDPQGFIAAYANAQGCRPGVDWPFICRPRMGIFGGPRNEEERRLCLEVLFQFIAEGYAAEYDTATPPLFRRGWYKSLLGATDRLSQPPSFLDPCRFSASQITDFAVAHLALLSGPWEEIQQVAEQYATILSGIVSDDISFPLTAAALIGLIKPVEVSKHMPLHM